ncbi:arabinogalactan protein 30 [Euphorbia peplus]|nr:arabinogalactan protein 30 [Euphorbia peplus]
MGFGKIVKAVLLLQLSLLCFTVFSDEHIEAASPIPPPHHASAHPPALPPSGHHHHHHHAHPPNMAPGHHHHGGYAPAHSPSHAPAKAPYPHPKAPTHSPVSPPKSQPKPPSYHFPRSFVAVQGVIFCKSCKYPGVDTLLGAAPLSGATVKLQCNNTKYPLHVKATSDKNGYFFVEAPKSITNYGAHKCKVSLLSAPNTACSKITDLHGGLSGGALRPAKKYVSNKLPFVLFSVGPFAFEPKCPR